jgi:hypothetical protein
MDSVFRFDLVSPLARRLNFFDTPPLAGLLYSNVRCRRNASPKLLSSNFRLLSSNLLISQGERSRAKRRAKDNSKPIHYRKVLAR